ncbi:hypothetical protein ACFVAJ_17750 [Agromyces sp. NPDC057679]|uniref:hypothetical protein n=1 Tax=Agromyces sp. NPDC057679 TaxID=3346207 RepID=UPI0036718F6B
MPEKKYEYRVLIDGSGIVDEGLDSLDLAVSHWSITDEVTVQRSKRGRWKTVPPEAVLEAEAIVDADGLPDRNPETPATRRLSAPERLEWLADRRMEYLSAETRKLIADGTPFSFWSLSPTDQAIYSEIGGMRAAAQALRGDDMWGWLPSLHWEEWAELEHRTVDL